MTPLPAPRGRAYLVGIVRNGEHPIETEQHLDELSSLADTAAFEEAGRAILPRRTIHPATFIGKGQAEEVGLMARALDASLVIVDEDLSPAQSRNLESVFDLPVVDRSGLIIDIFAERAQSRLARTQVEIAQLEYLLPRLAGRWSHLSRQVGGGPGGTKGEGEKQIELDRRMIRRRVDALRRDMSRLLKGRGVRRKARRLLPQAAFVGYTNVGKSSLFNAMVRAGVLVENRLFATLDPTVRRLDLGPRGALLLKDTVGLIRRLPHHLVASFHSTFEEAGEADLLVHVVDASHPSSDDQRATVERVLGESGLEDLPRLTVINKIDRLSPEALEGLRGQDPQAVLVSALSGAGIGQLVEVLADRLLGREMTATVEIPADRGDVLAWLHSLGRVERWESEGATLQVTLRATGAVFAQLERNLGGDETQAAG